MIDPQGQANRWLRNMYASKNLQIIKLTEKVSFKIIDNFFLHCNRDVTILLGFSPDS